MDTLGNSYVFGTTSSTDFTLVNPFQAVYGGGANDAFVAKLNAAGSALIYSTYLGGSYSEGAQGGILVDVSGNVYVSGSTNSPDFPTTAGALQTTYGGGGDAFVAKLNAAGSALVYSTYLGGSMGDGSNGSMIDASGNVYVFGSTDSPDFPTTAGALQTSYGGGGDTFVAKLNVAGSVLVYSTYLGGSGSDAAREMKVDASGNAYVSGVTNSTDFPLASPLQWSYGGGANDAFVAKLNAAGSELIFSSYMGGSDDDRGTDIALDAMSNIYLSGVTDSTDFPTINPFQAANGGGYDAFVAKIRLGAPVDLPRTGQTTCYDTAGAVIPCAGTGQDGEIQAGVPWPNPRFTDNGDQTVTDNLTGLMWTKDGNAPGPVACSPGTKKTWQEALDYVACLNTNAYLGYTDWHLPNINELESIAYSEQADPAAWLNTQAFSNVSGGDYWSSTSFASSTSYAWEVWMSYSHMEAESKSATFYVWPARYGQSGVARLWETGQTTCYDGGGSMIPCAGTGQDGAIQAGVPWPDPRFTDNGNGTVTDNLSGLVWSKDASAPGPAACSPGGYKTWQGALDYVSCLNANVYLGYTDWRLPNRKELHSLSDFSRYNPSLPSGHPFLNVRLETWYWSSTSANYLTYDAWIITMWVGVLLPYNKTVVLPVWPVRGGQVEQVSSCTQNTYYQDADGDGYGNLSVSTQACTQPAGYVTNSSDCDDSNASVHPGAIEVCNGVDDNCNGQIDEGVQNVYYRDADSDTYGNVSITTQACTQPSGYVSNSSDCNDSNATIHPGALEVCNGIDDNCNGQIDDGVVLATYYQDADSDTYGNASVTTQACIQPSGYVSNSTDCHDSNASIHPGATEIPNDGIDQDCNGSDLTTIATRMTNISTRAYVGTGNDREIGGFIISGSTPKTVMIRGRGPSMSGAPFNMTGTLSNPYLRLYSSGAGAYIAQNDNWGNQSDPLCSSSGYVCATSAEIMASGLNPCLPNPGQTTAPPGCSNESAIKITLPPGAYSAVFSGVNNGTGTGLIEIFDIDGSTTSKLVNISTRAKVLTGNNRMIGGFIVDAGTGSKKLLLRARGQSMSGAPFNMTGTLSNPYMRLYSSTAGAYIAQNDNWGNQSDTLCASSGFVCGTPTEITATGLDPCTPNPGQSTTPPGCSNESAMLITLPSGSYSAVVSGVNNTTGIGLMEVFEVAP